MKITVVTPCYNQAKYLGTAIKSVLAQTVKNFQYLLLDDGSTDTTWQTMQKFAAKDSRIKCIKLKKQHNVGPVLNRSIREATGDYWVWCPSDDAFAPNLLEKKRQMAKEFPNSVLYSEGRLIDGMGMPKQGRWGEGDWTPEEFAKLVWTDSPIGFTGIWIPMTVFDQVGTFPTHLKFSEDFAWMIRATMHGVAFRRTPGALFQKRIHANRNTSRNISRILDQVPRIRASLRTYQGLLDGTQP